MIQVNLTQADPSLADLMNISKRDIFLSLNCHAIGTVQSFDATKQTAQVTINYKKTYFQYNADTKVYDSVLVDYPLLADCPVIVIGGGPVSLTMPIAQGDQCLLLFNDRDIDNWFAGSNTSAVNTPRAHSFADALALVGPNSLNTIIDGYDPVRALITNGTVSVGVNPSTNKVTLTNGTSLNTLLQNLCTQLQTLTSDLANLKVTGVTAGADPSGVPVNASGFTTLGTNISSIATQIGGLLE